MREQDTVAPLSMAAEISQSITATHLRRHPLSWGVSAHTIGVYFYFHFSNRSVTIFGKRKTPVLISNKNGI